MSIIKKFNFFEVIVPAKEGTINSKGVYKPLHMLPVVHKASDTWAVQFDELPKLIVKMTLNDGTIGWGEFYRDHNMELVKTIAHTLVGKDINTISLQSLPIGLYREYDGFECAIWDAYAKLHSMRLVDLLGGQVQKQVKVGAWSSYRFPKEMGDIAKKFHDQGYDCLKLKADSTDPVKEWCQTIDEHAKGMNIIFDPNQRWNNLGETKAIVKRIEDIGNVFILEDPMPFWMLQDYKLLRAETAIRIVRHISLPYIYQGQRPHDIINVLMHQAADGFNVNAGLHKFRLLSAVIESANMYFWHGSEIDLGILEAMYVHQAAASAHCIWPSDIFGRLIRSHDLLSTPLHVEQSYVSVPHHGYGLGIEVDERAIETYKQSEGEVSYDK